MPTLATVTDRRQIRPEAYWVGLTRTALRGREVGIRRHERCLCPGVACDARTSGFSKGALQDTFPTGAHPKILVLQSDSSVAAVEDGRSRCDTFVRYESPRQRNGSSASLSQRGYHQGRCRPLTSVSALTPAGPGRHPVKVRADVRLGEVA